VTEKEVEKLVEKMGEDIEEKIAIEIRKNNKKIRDSIFLVIQIVMLIFVSYLELSR